MKPKTLAVLVGILAILGGLVYVRQAQQSEVSIVEQVELATLVPDNVTLDKIDKLVLYTGDRAEKKVELAKTDDGWRTVSYHNSPATSDKVEPFIEKAVEADGEFRAKSPDAGLADYGLAEDNAFHIEGYTGDQKAFHVLVGKSPRHGTVFMRAAGSNDVYVTNASLREEAGLFGDTAGMAASPDWWLDKSVLSMDTAQVTAIDLTYPDKHIKLERRRKPGTEKPEQAGDVSDAAEDDETPVEPEPEPEYEWVVAEGGLEKTLKTAAVDQILRKLGSMTATTIVNPEKKDDYSLNPPNFVARIALADGTEKIINGGRPEPLKGTYLMLADDPDGIVYSVSRFDFEDIFPFGSDLYDFEPTGLNADDVIRIKISAPDFTAVAAKDGEDWKVESPVLSLNSDAYKPRDIAIAASSLTIKDYAAPADHYGLDDPIASVTFAKSDGSEYSIGRGISSTSVDGHYVALPGYDYPVVSENLQLNRIFVKLSDLFDRTLFAGMDDEAIVKIDIQRESERLTLEDREMLWNVTSGEVSFDADFDTVDDYRFGLTVLEADTFEVVENREPVEPEAVVTLTLKDGTTHTLTIEGMLDGVYSVTTSNHPGIVFSVGTEAIGRVLRDTEFFRPELADETGAPTDVVPTDLDADDPHAGHEH